MESSMLGKYAATEFTETDDMAFFASMKLEIGKQWVRARGSSCRPIIARALVFARGASARTLPPRE